jgi:hypothetical protein
VLRTSLLMHELVFKSKIVPFLFFFERVLVQILKSTTDNYRHSFYSFLEKY